jgi:hypothetical protein
MHASRLVSLTALVVIATTPATGQNQPAETAAAALAEFEEACGRVTSPWPVPHHRTGQMPRDRVY